MSKRYLLEHLGEIVAAHVSNNVVSVNDLPDLIRSVHTTLAGLGSQADSFVEERKSAVSVRASVKPDALICLECGASGKALKRHLRNAHDLTPDEYRARWNLSRDYPMVSLNYSAMRKEMALKIGLGRKPAAAPAGEKAE